MGTGITFFCLGYWMLSCEMMGIGSSKTRAGVMCLRLEGFSFELLMQVRQSVAELKNALRLFSQLSGISSHHVHGFDEKKVDMHVEYCKHLLEAAKVHLEAAEREEQQTRQKQEVARQMAVAEEARRKAEDERKLQVLSV